MAQRYRTHPPMQETRVRFLGGEDPLQKEKAPHSSIRAWRIQWAEELAGYSPWGHKELDTVKQLHATPKTALSCGRPAGLIPVGLTSATPSLAQCTQIQPSSTKTQKLIESYTMNHNLYVTDHKSYYLKTRNLNNST